MAGTDGVDRSGHDVRTFLAEVRDEPYTYFSGLVEARHDPNGTVVLSGDYGGTIFLTAPARLVKCSEAALATLVSDLDAITWMSGDPTIATVAFETHTVASGVVGGDGGGVVIDGVWVHPRRIPEKVAAQAVEVVLAIRDRIDTDLLRRERRRELERKRAWREANPPAHPKVLALGWDFDISEPVVPLE